MVRKMSPISGPSSPQRIAIPTELSRPMNKSTKKGLLTYGPSTSLPVHVKFLEDRVAVGTSVFPSV
jgi:hypothetical protein